MATHSGILAWRIPWTEEPGGPQSMGSHSWTWLKRLSLHTCRVSSIVVPGVLSVTVITKQQLPVRVPKVS